MCVARNQREQLLGGMDAGVPEEKHADDDLDDDAAVKVAPPPSERDRDAVLLSGGATLSSLVDGQLAAFENWLSACGIDTTLLGQGKAKSVHHLLTELHVEDCALFVVDDDGSQHHTVDYVLRKRMLHIDETGIPPTAELLGLGERRAIWQPQRPIHK